MSHAIFYARAPHRRVIMMAMLRKAALILLIVIVLLGVLALSPAGDFLRIVIGVNSMERQIQRQIGELSLSANYQPIGAALARLCQSDPTSHEAADFGAWWAPAELRALKPSWILVEAERAYLEFGGGFHHFGYSLELDKNASEADLINNHWTLNLYNEGRPDKLLNQVAVAKTDRVGLKRNAPSTAPGGR